MEKTNDEESRKIIKPSEVKVDYPPKGFMGLSEEEKIEKRRLFLKRLGWSGIWLFLAGSGVSFIRFFFPRVLFEPKTTFKAGLPSEYKIGAVDLRFQKSQRVWIVREVDHIYALLAVCTHLGCTPVWWESENKFKCPCHGSGFTKAGLNYEGPAPRPLERVKITLSEDGQILIDKSKVFRWERGEWELPGSFLPYSY